MSIQLLKMKTLVMILILFLVTLSLGIATYSWYIVSTAPTVRAVETYMKVIDPVLSIARATDETTEPEEVSNQDARNDVGTVRRAEDKYYDITWGAVVDSFQYDNLKLDFPATFSRTEKALKTASFGADNRLDKLVPVSSTRLGYNTDGEYGQYGLRYYTCPDGKTVCAVGLAVWLRINQQGHDLAMSVANVSIKNAVGTTTVSNDKVKVAARVLTEGYQGDSFIPAEYNAGSGTHVSVIYDKDDARVGAFPSNKPTLVEVIVYVDGGDGTATGSQTSIFSKDMKENLYINIESVTFYDNLEIAW